MVEIYGLYDPESGALRYVGKAKKSALRFKNHLREAIREDRPVHRWIRKLMDAGKLPRLEVLESVEDQDWQEAEIRLIALHRTTSQLLNIADGGDKPHQTTEQRREAGRASNRAQAAKGKEWAALVRAKKDLARLATQYKKAGDIFEWWCLKMYMHRKALAKPHYYGSWLIHE